jgi:hypothetical protein
MYLGRRFLQPKIVSLIALFLYKRNHFAYTHGYLYIIYHFSVFILHYNKTVVVKGIDSAFSLWNNFGKVFCNRSSLLQWVMTEGNTVQFFEVDGGGVLIWRSFINIKDPAFLFLFLTNSISHCDAICCFFLMRYSSHARVDANPKRTRRTGCLKLRRFGAKHIIQVNGSEFSKYLIWVYFALFF